LGPLMRNWWLAGAMFASSGIASADVIFTDSTFNLANYSESSPFNSGSSSIFQQCANCGNPGTALLISTSAPSGSGTYAQAFINNSFAYNPGTQGSDYNDLCVGR
jgi:hypothetical protein